MSSNEWGKITHFSCKFLEKKIHISGTPRLAFGLKALSITDTSPRITIKNVYSLVSKNCITGHCLSETFSKASYRKTACCNYCSSSFHHLNTSHHSLVFDKSTENVNIRRSQLPSFVLNRPLRKGESRYCQGNIPISSTRSEINQEEILFVIYDFNLQLEQCDIDAFTINFSWLYVRSIAINSSHLTSEWYFCDPIPYLI